MQAIINKIRQTFESEKVVSILFCGNQSRGDIGLFVVIEADITLARILIRNMDITLAGFRHLDFLISVRDPLITEPLLTGMHIFGKSLEKEKNELLNSDLSAETFYHYLYLAETTLMVAEELYDAKRYEEALLDTVSTLRYLRFLEHYQAGGALITLSEMIERNPGSLLSQAYHYFSSRDEIKPEKVMLYLLVAKQLEKKHKEAIS
jgi:hypothetical protein